jgi:hypothetical protein
LLNLKLFIFFCFNKKKNMSGSMIGQSGGGVNPNSITPNKNNKDKGVHS